MASVEGKNSNRETQTKREIQRQNKRERERRRARRCVVQTPDWEMRKPSSLTPALVLSDESIANCRINLRCPKTGRSQFPSFVILFNFAINSAIYEGDPN